MQIISFCLLLKESVLSLDSSTGRIRSKSSQTACDQIPAWYLCFRRRVWIGMLKCCFAICLMPCCITSFCPSCKVQSRHGHTDGVSDSMYVMLFCACICVSVCSHLHKPLHWGPHTDGRHTHSFCHEHGCPRVGSRYTVHTGTDLQKQGHYLTRGMSCFIPVLVDLDCVKSQSLVFTFPLNL